MHMQVITNGGVKTPNKNTHKMTVTQLTKEIEKIDKKLMFSSRLKAGVESELTLQVTTLRRIRTTLESLEVQLSELKDRAK